MTMFVCYIYADQIFRTFGLKLVTAKQKTLLLRRNFKHLSGPNMMPNFWEKQSLIFGETDYSFFFFEESARQTPVSTL